MKKYLKSSEWHWLMFIPALITSVLLCRYTNNRHFDIVLSITIASWFYGWLWEYFQMRGVKMTPEKRKYSDIDIAVTTIAGMIGAITGTLI